MPLPRSGILPPALPHQRDANMVWSSFVVPSLVSCPPQLILSPAVCIWSTLAFSLRHSPHLLCLSHQQTLLCMNLSMFWKKDCSGVHSRRSRQQQPLSIIALRSCTASSFPSLFLRFHLCLPCPLPSNSLFLLYISHLTRDGHVL